MYTGCSLIPELFKLTDYLNLITLWTEKYEDMTLARLEIYVCIYVLYYIQNKVGYHWQLKRIITYLIYKTINANSDSIKIDVLFRVMTLPTQAANVIIVESPISWNMLVNEIRIKNIL